MAMDPTDSKNRFGEIPLKRILISLVVIGLGVLFLYWAYVAVGLGGPATRESGGLKGGGIIHNAFSEGLLLMAVLFIALTSPMAGFGGAYQYGAYAVGQLWIIFGACLLATGVLAARRPRLATWVAELFIVYVVTVFATNCAARWFHIDHTHDFPLERKVNTLDWSRTPTEGDIVALAGEPLARREFKAEDAELPMEVSQKMREGKQAEALILAYHERERWGGEATYYVLVDPVNKRVVSRINLHRNISDKWPFLAK